MDGARRHLNRDAIDDGTAPESPNHLVGGENRVRAVLIAGDWGGHGRRETRRVFDRGTEGQRDRGTEGQRDVKTVETVKTVRTHRPRVGRRDQVTASSLHHQALT